MLSLQQELDALREERARENDIADRRQRRDEDEIQMLRERCEVLESSGGGAGGSVSVAYYSFSLTGRSPTARSTLQYWTSSSRTWRVS